MKRICHDVVNDWLNTLNHIGHWPDDTIPRVGCAGIAAIAVCLMAHFYPFTIEAFFAALLAYGCAVLAMLIFTGIGVGVLTGIVVFMDRQAAAEKGKTTPERQGIAGQEGAAPAMLAESAPAPESVDQAVDGDQPQREKTEVS